MTETHLMKGQPFKLSSFKEFHNSYSEVNAAKPRGGISCFIKDTFIQYAENVNINVSGNISRVVPYYLDCIFHPPTRFIMIPHTSVPLQVCSHLLVAITCLLVEI